MKNQELSRQLQRINTLLKKVDEATGMDIEMQSHWSKYICVLCAGFIENAISGIYSDFVDSASNNHVANYAKSNLSKIQNPKTAKFVETARAFKESWASDLENFVAIDGRKEAVDSIMQNRHLIAHGKDSGISIVRLKEWLKKSVDILDFIETQCTK